ncbi:MAG: hypothetical protein BWK76_03000 [Desulfobulbaceae bacterium A2]|nr:MAG: hypothetical protein BWK76_03000 [Desulfobulbaceae bacterium A2]
MSDTQTGVTLLELTLVLLLITLMSGLAVPRLWSRLSADPLDSSGRRLAGFIQQAGDLARREQRPIRLVRAGDRQLLLQDAADGTSVPNGVLTLPREVNLSDFMTRSDGQSVAGEPQLLFSPKGYVVAAALLLSDRRGRRLLLELEPFLGTVSLRRQDGRPFADAP